MKILFVSDVSISKIIGGAERVLFEQCTRIAKSGHQVHLLTRLLPYHETKYENIFNVNEWRFECDYKNQPIFLLSNIRNAKNLFEKLQEKYHFEVINFHQPFSSFGVLQSSLCKKIRKIYTCHSLSFEEFLSRNTKICSIFNKILTYFQVIVRKKIEKIGLNRSDKIVTLSKFTQKKLEDIYGIAEEKIHNIPGGIDLRRFNPANDKTEIRGKLNFQQNSIILFTLRNLVHRMGLENLIKAFNELQKKSGDIQLVIGGSGPLKNELVALVRSLKIEEKVHFTGFIPEDQLPLYYQMADLFVLPTKELEGFGLVTLEAMASGLPVVGTPVGGTKEILGDFDSSFLFRGTDPNSIAKLILEKYHLIKHNPQKWQDISSRCRSFVEGNYSWEKNIDALEKLFVKNLQN